MSCASRARPSAAASVTMWPASEIRASELDRKPAMTSMPANDRVSPSAHARMLWLRPSNEWVCLASPFRWACKWVASCSVCVGCMEYFVK